jgi:C1A family cysteine protease
MKYLLKEDSVDERDFKFSKVISPAYEITLPLSVDLRAKMPPVYDQEDLGSCTANAGCGYLSYRYKKPFIMFSRLFLYYKERELEGTIPYDAGATMRSIAKALNKFGVCKEEYMPYVTADFAKPPSEEATKNALKYRINAYHSVKDLQEIKQCLALRQEPILLGMKVYSSFEGEYTKKSGRMTMPQKNEEYLGNHAVLVVGYYNMTKNDGYLIVRNSWGEKWGDRGYFYMPYTYLNSGYTFGYWTLF